MCEWYEKKPHCGLVDIAGTLHSSYKLYDLLFLINASLLMLDEKVEVSLALQLC